MDEGPGADSSERLIGEVMSETCEHNKQTVVAFALLLGVSVVPAVPAPAQPGSPPASPARFLTTEAAASDYWPCFSPDGKVVLFSRSRDGGKTWDLLVVPTAGGEARRLARSPLPVSATRANWSRRTNRIAFTGTSVDDKTSIWIIDHDGANPRRLVASGIPDRVLYPSWYPDGEHLAVMDASDNVIKRIDLERGTTVTVTDRSQVLTGMPAVSPDGKWIAFAGHKNGGRGYDQTMNSIWLIGDNGALHTVEPTAGQGRTPAWSPDGRWLAFQSNRGNASQLYAAFIINRDGTGLRQVTAFELSANHPVWSPDGARLAFSARHAEDPEATGIAIISVGGRR
jgi:Tol biopolymer transport system component